MVTAASARLDHCVERASSDLDNEYVIAEIMNYSSLIEFSININKYIHSSGGFGLMLP